MALAREARHKLEDKIRELPANWGFEDNVLVCLIPSFRSDVERYYNYRSNAMADLFKDHQLRHIDDDLVRILKGESPPLDEYHNQGMTEVGTEEAEKHRGTKNTSTNSDIYQEAEDYDPDVFVQNDNVFHRRGCRHLNYDSQWTYYRSRESAIKAGYHPCDECDS